MSRFDRKYRRIARHISPLDIQASYDPEDKSWDDLFVGDRPAQRSDLFLGHFSSKGIKFIIERFGLDRVARHRGIRHIDVELNTDDPYKHALKIYNGIPHENDNLVMEFVAGYQMLTPTEAEESFIFPEILHVLKVEWLNLQNPAGEFTHRRPRLPGQKKPGLGMGDELFALFTLMGRYLKVDGILNVPEHYHTGLMFGRRFRFLDVRKEAIVHAVARDLWQKYRLAVIAWGSALGAIRETGSGTYFKWQPAPQIIPLKPLLRSYFSSDAYRELVEEYKAMYSFELDEETMRAMLAKMDQAPLDF